jgi:hypothetical protein
MLVPGLVQKDEKASGVQLLIGREILGNLKGFRNQKLSFVLPGQKNLSLESKEKGEIWIDTTILFKEVIMSRRLRIQAKRRYEAGQNIDVLVVLGRISENLERRWARVRISLTKTVHQPLVSSSIITLVCSFFC